MAHADSRGIGAGLRRGADGLRHDDPVDDLAIAAVAFVATAARLLSIVRLVRQHGLIEQQRFVRKREFSWQHAPVFGIVGLRRKQLGRWRKFRKQRVDVDGQLGRRWQQRRIIGAARARALADAAVGDVRRIRALRFDVEQRWRAARVFRPDRSSRCAGGWRRPIRQRR